MRFLFLRSSFTFNYSKIVNQILFVSRRSYLSTKNQIALPTIQNLKPFRERYNKSVLDEGCTDTRIRSNHYLYTERTIMYIMADLSRKDEPAIIGSMDSETLLCSVTYDKARKLLTVDPDFGDEHDECYYNVTNSYGIKFNYRMEHVSQDRTSLEMQEQRENSRRVSMRLFMTRRSTFQTFASPRTDQKDTLFVEKPISTFSTFSYLFCDVSYNSLCSDSFLLAFLRCIAIYDNVNFRYLYVCL